MTDTTRMFAAVRKEGAREPALATDPGKGGWQAVDATVVPGYGVASGRSGDPRFPGGSLRMQAAYFEQRGLDLSPFHMGTVNAGIAPHEYGVVAPRKTFREVKWHPTEAAEDFSFFDVQVEYAGLPRAVGLIYFPHPETKPAHHQRTDVLELLLPFIPNLRPGERLRLWIPSDQMRIR